VLKWLQNVGFPSGLPINSAPLHVWRLRQIRRRLVTDPTRWQEEQCNECTSSDLVEHIRIFAHSHNVAIHPYLRIMMRPRPRTRPPSRLPPLHPFQLRRLVELHHTVDLPIRMLMILTRVLLLTVHEHRRYTKEPRFRAGQSDFGAPVFRAVHLDGRTPAFVVADALADVLAEIFVVGVAGAVVFVEFGFEVVAWCS
jgi:hypothetical protein